MMIPFEMRKRLGVQYLLDAMSPCSPYGAERVRRPRVFLPSERAELEAEWENVAAAMAGLCGEPQRYDQINHLMMQVRDIRGTLQRCEASVLTEIELFEVKRFLLQLSRLVALFEPICVRYQGITFTEERSALDLLDPEGRRSAGFSIGNAYSVALRTVREEKRAIEQRLRETPQGNTHDDLLNARQLIVAREEAETLRVRDSLTKALRPFVEAMQRNADMIGRLDYTIQKAVLAQNHRMTKPIVSDGGLRFDEMENPEVTAALAERGQAFTRVSIEAPSGVTVITGANMGGKSVALQTLALNVFLCQAGFFACAERAALPLFDALCLIGEEGGDSRSGLSSFGAEVLQIQAVLERIQGGQFCFVSMDEPGRGTNPREGAALVQALVRRLADARTIAVIATHYDGTTDWAQAHYQAAGLKDLPAKMPREDRLAFIAAHMDYGLTRVEDNVDVPQAALAVCRLLGLDGDIVAEMERRLET